ncbi:MAG: GH3 auxin-responsive promoter family protein [Proteobacteria bacterium]|nr:GH3 auxin-responsive promoter family protein [Pseudomonadota bacterium]MCP4915450.1 GH3 auxin-responsive promoter family protein [Pseudomonadota bacterium]
MPYRFPEDGHGPYRLFRGLERASVDRYHRTLDDPASAQQERLRAILGLASPTAFGREHGLRPELGLDRFREQVPVREFDELAPWMDRVHAGEERVLTTSGVKSLLKTSGTTGASKLLPVTEPYAAEVKAGQDLWRLALIRDHEAVTKGSALTVTSPAEEGRLPSGIPYGSNTGRMQDEQPLMVRLRFPIPSAVQHIGDAEARIYALLRFALQARISTLTTANPSTVLMLCRKLQEHRESLGRDLAAGTCREGPARELKLPWRARLRLRRTPVPTDWRPARLWPLATVNCWKGGPARFFLDRFPEALGGDVPVREVGLTASEGYFAVPMTDGDEGGVAWLGGHVLEFLDDDDTPHWAWELETGRTYRLVITTSAGLCRYDLNDLVEVTGHAGRAPILRFVRKGANVLSVTGEKVSEDQLVRAMTALSHLHDAVGFTLGVRMAEVPVYQLAIEGPHRPELAAALDRALQEGNVEYASKRETRLGPLELVPLSDGTYARHRRMLVEGGAPDGQVKDVLLAVDATAWDHLRSADRRP